jgi:acetylornithine deacetylase/succinyl-diaminopimelate desuccinylase-like protein
MTSSKIESDGQDLAARVHALMPKLTEYLKTLVAVPSVYKETEDQRTSPVHDAAVKIQKMLTDTGLSSVDLKCIGDEKKNAPLIYARYQVKDAPAGTPTVLLYAHYDVVEAAGWQEAFKPEVKADGRLYGRGAADDKSGVMMHVGALGAFDGKPPVNLTIMLEGEEESGDRLEQFVAENPDLFEADVIVVADTGNYELGKPTFTTSLRGTAVADLTVTTLDNPVHSGTNGGPVPDAFMVLVRMLARLHDDAGDVAVPGLVHTAWEGYEPKEADVRTEAGLKAGVKLIGTGTLGARLYTKPSINVVGLDGPPPTTKAVNQLQATATARISVRIAPTEKPKDAFDRLRDYLLRPELNPWHAEVKVTSVVGGGSGFHMDPAQVPDAAKEAMRKAYPGQTVQYVGEGGSIPLVVQLQTLNPKAAMLVIGCEEPKCRIHSHPESVDLRELEAMTLAECHLLDLLGNAKTRTASGSREDSVVPAAAPAQR